MLIYIYNTIYVFVLNTLHVYFINTLLCLISLHYIRLTGLFVAKLSLKCCFL